MKNRIKNRLLKSFNPSVISILIGFLLLSFQNCAPSVQFTGRPELESSIPNQDFGNGDESEGPVGSDEDPSSPIADPGPGVPTDPGVPPVIVDPNAPVICDPFSSSSMCANPPNGSPGTGPGLIGKIYYFKDGIGVNSYIQNGYQLPVSIQLSHLDIPQRGFTEGFLGPDGELENENGERLIEWFALDLGGFFKLRPDDSEGDYQFAVLSDDGAILDLNGTTIIDNDGTHAPRWKCSSVLSLKANESLPMRLRYYQGPRDHIALQVFWRPSSLSHLPCDRSGNWSIVPAETLSH